MTSRVDPPPQPQLAPDRLGARRVMTDASGEAYETFRPIPELAAMRESIRERVLRLAKFRQARFVPVRSVEVAPDDPAVIEILSDHVPGLRLSDLLGASESGPLIVEPGAALHIVRETLAALALLHESRGVTHGVIGPERIIITREGRVVVCDYVFGLAFERLRIPRSRLWSEFRIAMPAGAERDDGIRADLTQIGVLAVALLAGRLLEARDYPRGIPSIIRSLKTNDSPRERQALPAAIARWLEHVIGLEDRSGIATARQAQFELESAISKHAGLKTTASSLKTLAARHQSLIEPANAAPAKAPARPEPITVESLRREAELTLVPRLRPRKNLRVEGAVVSTDQPPAAESAEPQSGAESDAPDSELPRQTPIQLPAEISPIITAGEALVADTSTPPPETPRAVWLPAAYLERPAAEISAAPDLPQAAPFDLLPAAVESVVAEPIVAEAIVTEPVVAEPVVAEAIVTEPVVAEPVVAEAIIAEPVISEAVVAEPIVAEVIVTEPVVAEPGVAEPVAAEAVVAEPGVIELIVGEPVISETIRTEPAVAEPVVAEPLFAEPIAAEAVVAEPVVVEAVPPSLLLPQDDSILSGAEIESLAAEIAASTSERRRGVSAEPGAAKVEPRVTEAASSAPGLAPALSVLSAAEIESLAADIAASVPEVAPEAQVERSSAQFDLSAAAPGLPLAVIAEPVASAPELPPDIPISRDAAPAAAPPAAVQPVAPAAPGEAAFDAVTAFNQAGPVPASFVELPSVDLVPPYLPQAASPAAQGPSIQEPGDSGISSAQATGAEPNPDDERIELRFEEGLSDSLFEFTRREWFVDDDRGRLPEIRTHDDQPAADHFSAREFHEEPVASSSAPAETPSLESQPWPASGVEVESALSLAGSLSRRPPITPSEARHTLSAEPDESATIGDPNISHAWAPDHDRPDHLPSEHHSERYPSIAYRPPSRTASRRRARSSKPALSRLGSALGRLGGTVARGSATLLYGAVFVVWLLLRVPIVVIRALILGSARLAAGIGSAARAVGSFGWRAIAALVRGTARTAASASRAAFGGFTRFARVLSGSIRAVGTVLVAALGATARGAGRVGGAVGTTGVRGIASGGGLAVRAVQVIGSAAVSPLEWMWRRAARRGFPMLRPQYLLMGLIVPLALQGLEVARERWLREDLQAGTVRLSTRASGLSVFIDGVSHGKGPFELRLSGGRHRLEFGAWWFGRQTDFEVQAGQEVAIASVLRRWSHAGSLRVVSQPDGAQVFIDGAVRGVSPLSLDDVSLGTHTVTVRGAAGTVSRSVNVTADAQADLLVPIYSGWIAVFAPVEIDVIDNGSKIGTTESGHLMVGPGEHTIELVSERLGYRASRTVMVKPGEIAAVNVELPQVELEIVAPAGAEVLIDGQSVGTAPLDTVQVSVGTRDVAIRHASFGERHQAVTITYRSTNRVVFNPPE